MKGQEHHVMVFGPQDGAEELMRGCVRFQIYFHLGREIVKNPRRDPSNKTCK